MLLGIIKHVSKNDHIKSMTAAKAFSLKGFIVYRTCYIFEGLGLGDSDMVNIASKV